MVARPEVRNQALSAQSSLSKSSLGAGTDFRLCCFLPGVCSGEAYSCLMLYSQGEDSSRSAWSNPFLLKTVILSTQLEIHAKV